MSIQQSARVQRIQPSATIAVTRKAADLRRQGHDVIGLGAGEPDFDTPAHIKAAAMAAIEQGQTKYTNVDGTPEIKDAVMEKLRRDNRLTYGEDQILVSSGAKQSLFNLFAALIGRGDEAVIPAPCWVSYPDMISLLDGKPVVVTAGADQQFKMTPHQLESALTDRTKLLILNSPSNPTGKAYTRGELQALARVLKNYPKVVIASDEIYEHIYWGSEPYCSWGEASPETYDRTVIINGVSKAYAMTGWRIGFAAGPADLIAAMRKIQSQSTSNPSSISQAAAAAALGGDQSCLAPMCHAFKQRHDYVVAALDALPGFRCLEGDGAFYAFPNVEGAIAATPGVENDTALCEFLLSEAGVALVPGAAFAMPGHIRLSYACGLDTLQEAVARISRALETA